MLQGLEAYRVEVETRSYFPLQHVTIALFTPSPFPDNADLIETITRHSA